MADSNNPSTNTTGTISDTNTTSSTSNTPLKEDTFSPHPPEKGRVSPANATAGEPSSASAKSSSPSITIQTAKLSYSPSASRSPSLRATLMASPPLSPRLPSAQSAHHSRAPSFSSPLNMVELLAGSNGTHVEAKDWKKITLGQLVQGQQLHFIDGDKPVEEACQMLVDKKLTSLLLRQPPSDSTVTGTFDYTDLTAFLLTVLGVPDPSIAATESFREAVKKAREGDHNIPVKLVGDIGIKDPFITLPETEKLSRLVEILATGVHRVAITKENSPDVIGVLSQRKVVKYFWENVRSFVDLEPYYSKTIGELCIGSTNVISINADARVITALETMTSRRISSIAVVDHQKLLVGNISLTDVQYVARTSSAHLLRATCAHFLSVIKFEQGVRDGRDVVPVFAVYPTTSLASTVAKLVATRAHRMWIVGNDANSAISPVGSTPSTPLVPHVPSHPATMPSPPPMYAGHSHPQSTPPLSATPSSLLLGKLQGVVSLTDILNLFARVEGLTAAAPTSARTNRRRSSSSSTATSVSTTSERRR